MELQPIIVASLVTGSITFVFGYALSYKNHGLSKDRDSEAARREFRGAIRSFHDRIESCRSIAIYNTYQGTLAEVKDRCFKIMDDVPKRRRSRLQSLTKEFSAFTEDRLNPRCNGPIESEEQNQARRKARDEAKRSLCSVMDDDDMIDCAK